MGRLPTLSLFAGVLCTGALACDSVSDKQAPMATNVRSQVVVQKGPSPVSAPATIAVASTKPATPQKPRSLCSGKLAEAARAFPKKKLSRAAAKAATELSESLTVGSGKWTWLNF